METNSDFFALEASNLLFSGLADEAIVLCLKILDIYTIYPTIYVILIKAYILKDDLEKANEYIQKAIKSFPNLAVFGILYSEFTKLSNYNAIENELNYISIDNIDSHRENTEEHQLKKNSDIQDYSEIDNNQHYVHSPIIFMNGDDDNLKPICISDDKDIIDAKYTQTPSKTLKLVQHKEYMPKNHNLKSDIISLIPGLAFSPIRFSKKKTEIENHIKPLQPIPVFPTYIEDIKKSIKSYDILSSDADLSILSSKLINNSNDTEDKMKENHFNSDKGTEGKIIIEITETIANIYVQQKAYSEAIEAYKVLIERKPEKEEYYLSKISELQNVILNNNS